MWVSIAGVSICGLFCGFDGSRMSLLWIGCALCCFLL